MGAALGVLGAAQLLISEEQLAGIALIAFLGLALLATTHWHAVPSTIARVAPAFGVAVAVFCALSAFPIGFQFLGPLRPSGLLQPQNEYVSDLLNFIVPTSIQQIAPGWVVAVTRNFHGDVTEWGAYLGLPLIALLIWAACRSWASAQVRFVSSLGLLVALLSMGFTLHVAGVRTLIPVAVLALPFVALRRSFPAAYLLAALTLSSLAVIAVPVLDDLLPARLMPLAFLFASILLAIDTDGALRDTPRRGLKLGAAGVALAFLIPAVPFPSEAVTTPEFFTSAAVRTIPASSVALVLPFARAGAAPPCSGKRRATCGFACRSRTSSSPTAPTGRCRPRVSP